MELSKPYPRLQRKVKTDHRAKLARKLAGFVSDNHRRKDLNYVSVKTTAMTTAPA